MTTDEKSTAILKKICEMVNAAGEEATPFGLGYDWGDPYALTLTFPDGGHTHVGVPKPEGTFEVLIDQMYDRLINGRGLSKCQVRV